MSLQMVMFAYGGIEIIGITAGEAKDPEKSIPRAINSVPMRILVFYVGTLFVIMSIYPWNQVGTAGSPFVLTFQHMGITFAASILNFVVLTASLSAINSDVFGVGRMLHGMAEQGSAPKFQQNVASRYSVGYGAGDDYRAIVCGVSELHHAGKRLPGDRFAGNLRHGVGVDYDPAVANCLPSPFAARRS